MPEFWYTLSEQGSPRFQRTRKLSRNLPLMRHSPGAAMLSTFQLARLWQALFVPCLRLAVFSQHFKMLTDCGLVHRPILRFSKRCKQFKPLLVVPALMMRRHPPFGLAAQLPAIQVGWLRDIARRKAIGNGRYSNCPDGTSIFVFKSEYLGHAICSAYFFKFTVIFAEVK